MPLRPDQVARLPRLYHLTPCENLEDVLCDGLRPAGAESQFDPGLLRADCVYLAGLAVIVDQLQGLDDVMWGDAVVSVEPAALVPIRFRADEDYWRGLASARGQSTDASAILRSFPDIDEPAALEAQFRDLPRLAYAGIIAPTLLRLDFVWPRPDLPDQAALRARVRAGPSFGTDLTASAFLAVLARRWRWNAWQRAEAGLTRELAYF